MSRGCDARWEIGRGYRGGRKGIRGDLDAEIWREAEKGAAEGEGQGVSRLIKWFGRISSRSTF